MIARARIAAVTLALMVAGLSGCATDPMLESGPQPRVADCAPIKQATPPLYECNGKVYTANQLSAIRHGYQSAQ